MAVAELSSRWFLKLSSFVFWGNLYLYTANQAKDKSPEWWSRAVTVLHGSVCTVVGFYQCGLSNSINCVTLTEKVMPSQYALMLVSWGYFAFDLLWCLLYWPNGLLMLLHHGSALSAITLYMHMDYTGCTYACSLLLMEITNPLLQARWFLKKEGYGNTTLCKIIEIVYLIMFFGLRGIFGTYLMYYIFKTNIFGWEQKLIYVSLYLVSLAFMYDIMGFILYKYKKEANIGYKRFTELFHATCLTFNEWQPKDEHMQQLTFQVIEGETDSTRISQKLSALDRKLIDQAVKSFELSQIETEILARALSAKQVNESLDQRPTTSNT